MSLILATRGLARKFTPPAPPGGAVTPTASWNFDELSGLTADDAQNVQDGTYNNGPALGALPMLADAGKAIALKDGASARVAHNAAFEVSLWTLGIYAMAAVLPALGETMGIFSKVPTSGHANEVSCEFINTDGQLRIRAYTTTDAGVADWIVSSAGVGNLVVGSTYRVVIVQRASGASLYIDDTEFGPNVVTDGLANNNGPWAFGGYLHASQGLLIPLNGCLDQGSFWARSLTAQEIEALPAAQDTLHLVDWSENIDEGTGSINPSSHAWPESGFTAEVVSDGGSPANTDLTANGVTFDYSTAEISGNESDSATVRINKGALTSRTVTITLTVIDAGAGGGSGQALSVPSLADFLKSDEADPSVTKYVSNQDRGNGTGSSAANAQEVQDALTAASAGDVLLAVCQTPGTVEFWDYEAGLVFPNGSAGNVTVLQARQGDGVVITSGEDFSGARTANNGFWTQSGLSQADIDKQIWRSVSTFTGGSQSMMGCWVEFDHPHQIIQAGSMANLRAAYSTADSEADGSGGYAGPCVRKDADGRVYIRFQQPHVGKYSFGGKRGQHMWPGHPEAVNGSGQAVYPISQDPNDYAIYLWRIFDGSNGETAFRPATNGGGFIKIGSGINSYGFEQVTRGHDITIRRGLHWSWRRGLATGDDTNPLQNYDVQRARFTCGAREHLSRSEWKFGGPLENIRDAFLLGGALGDDCGNLNFKDCTIADFHELMTLGNQSPARVFRWRNCTVVNIYDDGIQASINITELEIGYCWFLNSAFGGYGVGGNELTSPNPGQEYIHHNIFDHRIARCTHWRAQPHPNPLWISHSPDADSHPRKIYNNLFIFGPDCEQESHAGLAHNPSSVDAADNFDAIAHELFNNIVIRWDTQRYDPLAGATYSDGSATDQSDFITRFHHFDGDTNELYDFNLYYRDVPAPLVDGVFKDMSATRFSTQFDYASLAAWTASAQFTASKLAGSQRGAYSDGLEGNSTDTKPTLATIDDFPTSRFQYRPGATSAVTVAASGSLSGEDWWSTPPTWGDDYFSWSAGGGTLEPDAFKGALDPSGSTLPVGVQTP